MARTLADLVEGIVPRRMELAPAWTGAGRAPGAAPQRRVAPTHAAIAVAATLALLLSVLAVPFVRDVTAALSTSTSPSTSTSDSVLDSLGLPSTLPSALEPVSAAVSAPAAYRLSEVADGWTASNPVHGFGVGFSADGPSIAAGAGALGLELTGVGRGAALVAPEAARVDADGALLALDRGAVTEWYVNDERGLEQGFTLRERPAGRASDPVVVQVTPTSGARPTLSADGASISFAGSGLTYRGLFAVDADGDALPATLGLDGGRITLSVDDRGATYPVVVDPVVATLQQTLFQPSVGALPDARFGAAVDLFGDTLVVGTPQYGGGDGGLQIFAWSGGTWVHSAGIGSIPDSRLGAAVAVSGHVPGVADTMVVGYPGDALRKGGAAVLTREDAASPWVSVGALVPSDETVGNGFGASVAVSGNTIVVGAPKAEQPNQDETGSVYVFRKNGTTWANPPFQVRLRDGTPEQFDDYGASVAIDGGTIVVGAPNDVTGPDPDGPGPLYGPRGGTIDIWTGSGTTWTRQADQVKGSDNAVDDGYGTSVAVDGDRVLVGARQFNGGPGKAYVLERAGTTWTQTAIIAAPAGSGDFGSAVALDGDLAVIGDPPSDQVHVLSLVGSSWLVQQTRTGVGGQAVGLDGTTAVVGRPFEDNAAGNDAGSARVYSLFANAPTVTVNLTTASPGPLRDLDFDVDFSTPVTGFGVDDLLIDGTGSIGNVTPFITDRGDHRRYIVSLGDAIEDGTYRLRIAAGAAVDSGGLASLASTSTNDTYTRDTIDPVLTMALAPGQPSPSSAATVRFRLTANEDLSTAAPIVVSVSGNAFANSYVVTPATPGDKRTFDIAVSGMLQAGAVTVFVPGGQAPDPAGNVDQDGSNVVTLQWVDDNTAPTINITAAAPGFGREGQFLQLGGVTDAEGDAVVTWTATRVSGADAGATCAFSDAHALAPTVTCNNDGNFTITATADDGVNPVATDDYPLGVVNSAPVLGPLTAPAAVRPGSAFEVTAPATDPGSRDVLTCTVAWGDSSTSAGTITAGVCRAVHTYAAEGFYTARMTLTDDSGASTLSPNQPLIRVARSTQSINFPAPAGRTYGDAPFTVSATSSSGLPVTFTVAPDGACTLSGTTVTITGAGNCDLTAHQAGNAQNEPAEDVFRRVVVAKKAVVVTASPATKVYGAPSPTVTPGYSGFLPGDDASDLIVEPACFVPDAGSYAVGTFPGATTCQGALSADYSFTYVAGTLTVTPRTLTVTAPDVTQTYGVASGDDPEPTITGYRTGEDETDLTTVPTCTGPTVTTPAGVNAHGVTCSGGAATNYQFTYVDGTATVNPAVVQVQPITAHTTYGTAANVLPAYNGFKNGETAAVLTTPPTCTGGPATQGAGFHAGASSCSGATAANYSFTYSTGDVNVTKAPLTIVASGAVATYGSPATVGTAYQGFVLGEDRDDLTMPPTCTSGPVTRPPGTHVGVTTCSGAVSPNYSFTYVPGDLIVVKAVLFIYASNASMTYGSAGAAVSPSYVGFVNGHTAATGLTTQAICSGGSPTTPIGEHPGGTTCSGATSSFYDLTYFPGTLTVTKAVVTITASPGSMTYGGTAPVITPSYSGFLNGDDAADLTTRPTCSGGSATTPAGTHTGLATCSGAADETYGFNYVPGTITVNQAQVFVTPNTATMTYGDVPPAITPSYVGFVNGQGPSVLTTTPTCGGASATTPAGSDAVLSCSGAAADNYTFAYPFGTLVVRQAPLEITASSESMTYGGAAPTVTAGYVGFKNGETAASLVTPPTCLANVVGGVGTSTTGCFGAAGPNYDIDYVAGVLTIGKAPLTVTAPPVTRTYGAANPTVTPLYSGFVLADDASTLTTPATCSAGTPTTGAGTHATTCSGATSDLYEISYVDGVLTVAKAPLTITASDATMPYGAAGAVVTPLYSGFVNGQSASALTTQPTCGGGTPTTPFGSHPGGTTCSGAVAANYQISYVAGTLNVNKAPLTIRAADTSSTYGSAPPAVTPTYVGFVLGDDASDLLTQPTCSTTGTATTGAGVHADANTCSGAAAGDRYEITYEAGDLTVAQAPLTITASAGSMTYGGTPPTITPSYSGFVLGQGASVLTTAPTCSGGTPATHAGEHAGATTCSGAAAANYSFTYLAGTLSVAKAPLTVTASDWNREYGSPANFVDPIYTGFQNWDDAADLTTAPICRAHLDETTPVGSHPGGTTCFGGSSDDYELGYVDGTLLIEAAPLTITASDGTMTYGGTPPTILPSYSGFENGETAAVLATPPTCAGGSSATHAGTHVDATTCSGAAAANYVIDYVAGDLTVAKAPLTITASGGSMTYGGTPPTITPSYAGFVNDEDATDLGTPPTCAGGSPTTPAGAHPGATACTGAASGDYEITYVAGDLSVAQAPLTVTASDETMVYGGTVPTVTPGYDGFRNDDDAADLLTAPSCGSPASPTTPAGGYPEATSCSGAAAANYAIAYVAGDLTVTKAPLVITASDGSMTYGGPTPAIVPTFGGFVNGEDASVLTTPPSCAGGSPTTHAGTHVDATTCSGAAAANYEITYVAGDLTVDKAILTVTADAKSKPFGDALPALTATTTGYVNGEGASAVSGAPVLSTTATASSTIGSYPITITRGTLSAGDYDFVLVPSTLTVTRATTRITATAAIATINLGGLLGLRPIVVRTELKARLTRGAADVPVPNQQVTFETYGGRLCTGTTDADGYVECKLSNLNLVLASVISTGYWAKYAGTADLAPATVKAALVDLA